MIKPLFDLLKEACVSRRTGVLLLVVACDEPVSGRFTMSLSFRMGDLVAVRGRGRRDLAAIRLLREASAVRRSRWIGLPESQETMTSNLPSMRSMLEDMAEGLVIPFAGHELPPSGQIQLERLGEIQSFMHAMAGGRGEDFFLKRVFEHPPSGDWEGLLRSLRRDIEALFGADVATRLTIADGNPSTPVSCF
ncbi:MAG: hypothetical protein O9327_13200 [Polaromonas sp.]|nr:hypothetical protein [Polaromonas sp.]